MAQRKRPQKQKPRQPRPRSTVFVDRLHDAYKKAARNGWIDEDIIEEIENWKEWV